MKRTETCCLCLKSFETEGQSNICDKCFEVKIGQAEPFKPRTCARCNDDCHANNMANYTKFNIERQKTDAMSEVLKECLIFVGRYRQAVITGEIVESGEYLRFKRSDFDLHKKIKDILEPAENDPNSRP